MPISSPFIICFSVIYASSTTRNLSLILGRSNSIAERTMISCLAGGIEGFLLIIKELFLLMVLSMKIIAFIYLKILHSRRKQTLASSLIHPSRKIQLWDSKERSWIHWWWRNYYQSFWKNYCRVLLIKITSKKSDLSSTSSTNTNVLASFLPYSWGIYYFPNIRSNLQETTRKKSMTILSVPHFVTLLPSMASYARTIYMKSILGAKSIRFSRTKRRHSSLRCLMTSFKN